MAADHQAPGSERGAVLVEAAGLVALLMAVIVGMATVASAWQGKAGVERMAQTMARLAADGAHNALPDSSLLAVAVASAANSNLVVDRVVVFRADSPDGQLPAGCDGPPQDNAGPQGVHTMCNLYGPAHLAAVAAGTTFSGCGLASPQRRWCPELRSGGTADPRAVGVLVEARTPVPVVPVGSATGRVVSAVAVVAIHKGDG